MSIVNLPTSPDILSVTQEQMVMLVIHLVTQIARDRLDPNYFDFEYHSIDNTKVNVSITGRTYSRTGGKSPWQGTKTIEVIRAKLNETSRPINLTVAFRQGMAFEHILRALDATYSFKVTVGELLLKDPVTGLYGTFSETSRPVGNHLEFKFSDNQARFQPQGSEFVVNLDSSNRPDINDYLHLIKAGSITGVV